MSKMRWLKSKIQKCKDWWHAFWDRTKSRYNDARGDNGYYYGYNYNNPYRYRRL